MTKCHIEGMISATPVSRGTMHRAWTLCFVALASQALAQEKIVWSHDAGATWGFRTLPNGDVIYAADESGAVIDVTPVRPSSAQLKSAYNTMGPSPDYARRLPNGNALIPDTDVNRVIEVAPDGGIVWSYGIGTDACGLNELFYPSDAVRFSNGTTVIADQKHSRLLGISPDGGVVWQYGTCTATGVGSTTPFRLDVLPGNDLLVTHNATNIVEWITPQYPLGATVRWTYGTLNTAGAGPNQLNRPVGARWVDGGTILIADFQNARVIEVAPTGTSGGNIVWQYGVTGTHSSAAGFVRFPSDAERLPNSNTRIAEQVMGNGRIFEISPWRMHFVLPVPMFGVGVCVGPIRLNLVDDQGAVDPLVVPDTLVLTPSAPELTLWSNAGCTLALTTSPLSAGMTGLDLYAQATSAGTYQIAASAARLVGDSVALTADAGVLDAGAPDAGPLDAGMPDAGVDGGAPDAGLVDGGTPDAGVTDAGMNSLVENDGGSGETPTLRPLAVGCDCASLPMPAVLTLLATLIWLRRSAR